MTDLAAVRRAYAVRMAASVQQCEPRIVDTFAAVPREGFVGAPPWTVIRPGVDQRSVDGTQVGQLYDDVLIELDGARGVNNGSPTLHMLMLHALGVHEGDAVVHVGIGGGYYTAILAELVGSHGRVTAVEFDPALAAVAATHLAPWANVSVIRDDGAVHPLAAVDRVYVNVGVVAPRRRWVDMLRPGGALVFPLTAPQLGRSALSGGGVVLRIGRDDDGVAGRILSPCGFVMAEGPLAGTQGQRDWLASTLRDRNLRLDRVAAGALWREGTNWPRVFAPG